MRGVNRCRPRDSGGALKRGASQSEAVPPDPSGRSPHGPWLPLTGNNKVRELIELHWDTAVAMALLAGCVYLIVTG